MITFSNVSKSYGRRLLFENISLSINRGEKVGLIGPNGAGKSTLFALILGEIEPSAGSAQVNKNIHIGYLAQESSFESEHTVLAELTEGDERIMRLKNEKEELEEKNDTASSRYGEILHSLEVMGNFELEHKAKKILSGLGFKERDFNRPIAQMSGGWQMRTLLAKLLTYQYDLLLLDEPTNYLDLNAAIWLKGYLADFKGTFIIISHDKAFLNEVTNYSLILENGAMYKVKGNYEHYERIKEEKRIYLSKQFKEQEKKREQLQRFVDRFHAQPNKAASVRAKKRVLEKMEEIAVPQDRRESIRNFHFPPTKRSGHRVMSLEKISKSYGDIRVYQDFDFEIFQGEKAVLAGENGAGKTTLLKLLLGFHVPSKGRILIDGVVVTDYDIQSLWKKISVLQQDFHLFPFSARESIAFSDLSRVDNLTDIKSAAKLTDIDSYIESLPLKYDTPLTKELEKGVDPSGGQRQRIGLARALFHPSSILVLDEPTSNVDPKAEEEIFERRLV